MVRKWVEKALPHSTQTKLRERMHLATMFANPVILKTHFDVDCLFLIGFSIKTPTLNNPLMAL